MAMPVVLADPCGKLVGIPVPFQESRVNLGVITNVDQFETMWRCVQVTQDDFYFFKILLVIGRINSYAKYHHFMRNYDQAFSVEIVTFETFIENNIPIWYKTYQQKCLHILRSMEAKLDDTCPTSGYEWSPGWMGREIFLTELLPIPEKIEKDWYIGIGVHNNTGIDGLNVTGILIGVYGCDPAV